MIKKFFPILFAFLFCLNCHAKDLSSEERIILEKFFRNMLEKLEGGYVLLGKKPVCIHWYYPKDCFVRDGERHLFSVAIREAVSTMKQLNKDLSANNIIIHIYERPDSIVKNCIHVLFINKNVFLKTVEDNLPLFQTILGPSLTPSKLLNKLTDPYETFHSVLKNNNILIGILLGFGTQNSIFVSRAEQIEENLFREFPPYKSQLSQLGDIRKEFLQILLIKEQMSFDQNEQLEPSFGYSSLKEEIKDMYAQLDICSSKLSREMPPFIFGRLKGDKDTDQLIIELEKAQIKIRDLLASEHFLKDVLQFIYPEDKINVASSTSLTQLSFNESEILQLPNLIAANILSVIDEEDSNYLPSFMDGMKDSDRGIEMPPSSINSLNYERLRALSKIKNNLNAANHLFEELNNDSTFSCIVPFKLYVKITQEGHGPVVDTPKLVSLHYTIKTPDQRVIADTWVSGRPVQLNLLEVFPGFAWGIKGMRKDEIREIIIHPSLGYGMYTTLDKGVSLRCYVQLIDFDHTEKLERFPELIALDLESEINSNIDAEFQEETKKIAYVHGYQIWQHYKRQTWYTLAQILEGMNQLQKSEKNDLNLNKNQDLINRVHWNIYNASNYSDTPG